MIPSTHSAVNFYSETTIPTALGSFRMVVYRGMSGEEPSAMVSGNVSGEDNVPVRVHSACFTSETMGSLKCDCRQQLELSLEYIQQHGGVLIYLPQEGRGIGLGNKIKAYALQLEGHDTISANEALHLPVDARTYEAVADILNNLKIRSIRLMTNNPEKVEALALLGVKVYGTIPVLVPQNEHSRDYLETKRLRMGHRLGGSQVAQTTPHLEILPFVASAPMVKMGRPFVHLNFAMRSPLVCQGEISRGISCLGDWKRVHTLREMYTGIAVGAVTWSKDRPRLTAREEYLNRPPGRQPDRVIFMGSKRYWPEPDQRRTFVVGSNLPELDRFIGIEVEGHGLSEPLAMLRQLGLESLLVEGGPTLLRSFLSQGIADEITIYVSTRSADQALDCAQKQFPELPSEMTVEPYGEGSLLGWSAASMAKRRKRSRSTFAR